MQLLDHMRAAVVLTDSTLKVLLALQRFSKQNNQRNSPCWTPWESGSPFTRAFGSASEDQQLLSTPIADPLPFLTSWSAEARSKKIIKVLCSPADYLMQAQASSLCPAPLVSSQFIEKKTGGIQLLIFLQYGDRAQQPWWPLYLSNWACLVKPLVSTQELGSGPSNEVASEQAGHLTSGDVLKSDWNVL